MINSLMSTLTIKRPISMVLITLELIMLVTSAPVFTSKAIMGRFQFDQSPYRASIPEDSKPGEHILTLSAYVSPSDNNSTHVRYRLLYTSGPSSTSSSAGSDFEHIFHLDEVTGELTVGEQASFDHESLNSYKLMVTARLIGNGAEIAKTAIAEVIVDILDVNDCQPIISILHWWNCNDDLSLFNFNSTQSPPINLTIPENQRFEDGGDLAIFNVFDADTGSNSEVNLWNNDSDRFVFELAHVTDHSSTFNLKLMEPIDRETEPEINLVVSAIDHGYPRLESSIYLKIRVIDVNDSPPMFNRAEIDVDVIENNEIPHELLRVKAIDPDLRAENQTKSTTKYTIINQNDDVDDPMTAPFEIDSDNGQITALKVFDREFIDKYVFEVKATDSESKLFSIMKVTVNVIDQNDNPPKFIQLGHTSSSLKSNKLEFKASEQAVRPGVLFGPFMISDADTGVNAVTSLKTTSPECVSVLTIDDNRRSFIHFHGHSNDSCRDKLFAGEIQAIAENSDNPNQKSVVTIDVQQNNRDFTHIPLLFNVSQTTHFVVNATEWIDNLCKRGHYKGNGLVLQQFISFKSFIVGYFHDPECPKCRYTLASDTINENRRGIRIPVVLSMDGRLQITSNRRFINLHKNPFKQLCENGRQTIRIHQHRSPNSEFLTRKITVDLKAHDVKRFISIESLTQLFEFKSIVVIITGISSIMLLALAMICLAVRCRKKAKESIIEKSKPTTPSFTDPPIMSPFQEPVTFEKLVVPRSISEIEREIYAPLVTDSSPKLTDEEFRKVQNDLKKQFDELAKAFCCNEQYV